MSARSIFMIGFLIVTLFEANKCEGTLKERTEAAKAIFSGNENIVSSQTAAFIRDHHKEQYALSVDTTFFHCDCITDKFAEQLANEYDLVSLQQMKNEPKECLEVVIDRLLNKSDVGVLRCLGAHQ